MTTPTTTTLFGWINLSYEDQFQVGYCSFQPKDIIEQYNDEEQTVVVSRLTIVEIGIWKRNSESTTLVYTPLPPLPVRTIECPQLSIDGVEHPLITTTIQIKSLFKTYTIMEQMEVEKSATLRSADGIILFLNPIPTTYKFNTHVPSPTYDPSAIFHSPSEFLPPIIITSPSQLDISVLHN
jgi:hypothetical protein